MKEAFKRGGLIFVFEAAGTLFLTIFYRLFLYFEIEVSGQRLNLVEENSILAFIFSYFVISFLSYDVTGAHFNPAITLAIVIKQNSGFNRVMGFFYIIA